MTSVSPIAFTEAMALRVLLADESTTIKKVMQLALQDFAIEVRTVHVGLDVLAVAKTFKPDIIFADILLQKKNGYEVCRESKLDPVLKSVPVILMWSSFMQLDDELANAVRSDDRLEKPFDVEILRQMIIKWSPKSKGPPPISSYLDFPDSIMEPLRAEEQNRKVLNQPEELAEPPPPPSSNWNMEDFDDINKYVSHLDKNLPDPEDLSGELTLSGANVPEPTQSTQRLKPPPPPVEDEEEEYQSIKLTRAPESTKLTRGDFVKKDGTATVSLHPPTAPVIPEDENEPWSIKGIDHFKLDLSREEIDNAEAIVPEGLSLDEPDVQERETDDPTVDLDQHNLNEELSLDAPTKMHRDLPEDLQASELSNEIRMAIERAVRDILPEIAERVVRQELKRILDEGAESTL